MNILELIRQDHEQFRNRFDHVDELGSAGARRRAPAFSPHSGRWTDPDDFEESHFHHSFLVDESSREVSLEDLDDRLAVDMWLREMARG